MQFFTTELITHPPARSDRQRAGGSRVPPMGKRQTSDRSVLLSNSAAVASASHENIHAAADIHSRTLSDQTNNDQSPSHGPQTRTKSSSPSNEAPTLLRFDPQWTCERAVH